jgi:hypothetical protein
MGTHFLGEMSRDSVHFCQELNPEHFERDERKEEINSIVLCNF